MSFPPRKFPHTMAVEKLQSFLLLSVLCILSFGSLIGSLSVYDENDHPRASTLGYDHQMHSASAPERVLSRHERDADPRENVTIKVSTHPRVGSGPLVLYFRLNVQSVFSDQQTKRHASTVDRALGRRRVHQ